MAEITELTAQNPWWEFPDEINKDLRVKTAVEQKHGLHPEFTFKHGVYSLRGPRQVGKTTWMKMYIRDLISKGKDPWEIMYLSVEPFSGKKEIIDSVRTYLGWLKRLGKGNAIIFLDDVTFIREWEHAIKFLADGTALQGHTLVFTGSSAADILHGRERMPGRGIVEIPFMPITFREYVRMFEDFGNERIGIDEIGEPEMVRKAAGFVPHVDRLNNYLRRYMVSGGFPKSIYELENDGKISEHTYETYVQWILGDLSKIDRSAHIFKQMVRGIIRSYAVPFSFHGMARNMDISTHSLVSDYIEVMRSLMLTDTLFSADIERKQPNYRKERKVYFRDVFLYHCFSKYVREAADESKLFEGLVMQHLCRAIHPYETENRIWFYRDGRGDVDAVLNNRRLVPVEITYGNRKDIKTRAFREYVIVTKDEFREAGSKVYIPASVFLYLLEGDAKPLWSRQA